LGFGGIQNLPHGRVWNWVVQIFEDGTDSLLKVFFSPLWVISSHTLIDQLPEFRLLFVR
jgi:hypothetical protein